MKKLPSFMEIVFDVVMTLIMAVTIVIVYLSLST